jgi:hypothetical protein
VLSMENLIIYGPHIVNKMQGELVDNYWMKEMVSDCILDDAVDSYELLKYIIRTYLRMRGKDFILRLMDLCQRSRSTQHWHEMAVLSNPKFWPKMSKRKTKAVNVTDTEENLVEVHSAIDAIVQSIVTEDEEIEDTDEDSDDAN